MNATNRGVIIGLKFTLESIAEIIRAIGSQEAEKETSPYSGAPISHRGITSDNLHQAADYIDDALAELEEIVPDKADFEEWLED